MTHTPLHALTATQLIALYSSGEASPVDAARAVIAQIERREPELKATYAYDPKEALRMAEASQVRWRKGEQITQDGVTIDGIPTTIKENIATKGVPVPFGTAATPLVAAARDAPPAARLREAGAVILGKTTMPEFGAMSSGLSSIHPLTRNPWNLKMNPGGSSAGAGAAGAAGYGPFHIGTDIGGSVRFPAGWNGLVGLKPSLGRVPIDPPFMGRCAGPMTRTVADAALMMAVVSRPDPDKRDWMNLPPADFDWTNLDMDLTGVKIGLQLDAGCGMAIDPQVIPPVLEAAKAFEAAGAIVEPVAPWMTDEILQGLNRFWSIRAAKDIADLPPGHREKILPIFLEWVDPVPGFTALEGYRAFQATVDIRKLTVAATKAYDFMLSPLSANTSFPAEWGYANNDVTRAHDQIGFTVPYNMSEQPAVSLCCGYDSNGVPMALQIAGQRFDDLGVLRMARAYEQMRPAMRPWPM
ncbi:amidase [Pseudosulfitobacter sp. DSM 107133]|uniref:amidase n=1 Tax=Pseudosulfitobacter sp. DSM 107133 TaxID=2883100 RepID=UPI000DF3ED32|nr:amidase [Pseudosulfitobacter sp. DSM 107133]UOA28994.1 Acylamidase [Pseudosulfitobacter sp. DSM 107133]